MQEQPFFLKMKKQDRHRERLQDKTELFLKVSYIATACCFAFALLCYFLLNITRVIPFILTAFALLNFLNL